MSSNKNVIVLAPNGRRQTVKVTPNTTILQILEEVCNKQGFKPEEYDIKHHNHVLDTSTILRFSGLPNNAQLEMATAIKTRLESEVTLGIQLENGNRVMGTFLPSDTLWHVLINLCPEESDIETNPVILYMRREIYGVDSFQEVTLRSLGLTRGRAMLRLIHRAPEELKTQANVSAPLPSKPSIHNLEKTSNNPKKIEHVKPHSTIKPDVKEKLPEEKQAVEESTKVVPMDETDQISDIDKYSEVESFETKSEDASNTNTDETSAEDVVFLGERNAIVFSLEMAKSLPHEDLPDEFYDLTVHDVHTLLKDLKKRRIEMEETPLQTTSTRNLEQEKKILRHLNQYKRSVLRIQFPDRTVLQGTFNPLETVSCVMEFVRGYLEDSSLDFYLYTTPPKQVLSPESRLVEADCVPTAIVHFGTTQTMDEGYQYLKRELLTQFSSYIAATLAASKTRGVKIKQDSSVSSVSSSQKQQKKDSRPSSSGASTSARTNDSSERSDSSEMSPSDSKVPKWFKSSQK